MYREASNSLVSVLIAGVLALALCVATGCGRGDREAASQGMTYTVRGEVKAIAGNGEELQVHHEEMPGFLDRQGKKTGMPAMVMPFGVGPGVDLSGLAVGDKVQLICVVDWKARPVLRIDAITELPADTALDL